MTYRVILSPEARDHLKQIRDHVRLESGSRRIATEFVQGIANECETLRIFPLRGQDRNGHGYRVVGFRKRVAIHFVVEPTEVIVLAFTYAGANWQTPNTASIKDKHSFGAG